MSGVEDADANRRKYKSPYTPHNPIPTIQSYREEQKQRRAAEGGDEDERSGKEKAHDAYRSWKDGDHEDGGRDEDRTGSQQVYPTDRPHDESESEGEGEDDVDEGEDSDDAGVQDTSEAVGTRGDAKDKRKAMKKRKDKGGEREVTDPVTHLPIKIHDFTAKDLKNTPENVAPPRVGTGLEEEELDDHHRKQKKAHRAMENVFPPPDLEAVGQKVAKLHATGLTVGLCAVLGVMVGILVLEKLFGLSAQLESKVLRKESTGKIVASVILLLVGTAVGGCAIWLVRGWTEKQVKDVWEREVWEAERQQGRQRAKSSTPESTQWLCELLSSVWPLVNPDLFTSLADTLEDVMQASLPRLVRMVSVEDIGQGSESLRILGIKWLPTGAASQTVTADGKLQKSDKNNGSTKNDRSVSGQGEIENNEDSDKDGQALERSESSEERKQSEQENQNISEGMEAEEGEFVNLEVAFAYKARSDGKGLRNRSKNAHLYLGFYLPANVKVPVWVELQGLVGVMRLRLQLTPDPPFFSLCTLTFLGQPKVDMSCVPLVKKGLNIMDVPVISNFVQSAVDAAMAEYVAPKSLTLDLKEMLMGDDFKKDTAARGVLVVRIKKAFDFKEGDSGLGPIKSGSADAYVTAGWAKFGKPVWSTRVIQSDMQPAWEETGYILVTPEELNVRERLRVQLWDSDRMTADDDLGRIEVDLRELMRDERSNGKMWDRQDGFRSLKAGEGMPGKLDWSVGYFSKTRILEEQVRAQKQYPEIKTIDDLKKQVNEESERKLREMNKDATSELEQQKEQDLKGREDQIIIATAPSQEYPSGVLSIVIHQITGLELEKINKNQQSKDENASDEEEEGDDLPSAYCTIILNHQKVFRTRTKPKNAKPFFNAGCERFIRDWRSAEIMISVRDARVHEDDALLGIVVLPLKDLFKHRSQVMDIFPLSGGVGYGKCRISLVFRSVQLQVPRNFLGWDYGTVEIQEEIKILSGLEHVKGLRLKARTALGRGKWKAGDDGIWKTKRGKAVCIAVKKRYCSPLVFEFRSSSMLKDSTPAFAIFWLKDIADDEEETIKIPFWKGDLNKAETNVVEECGEKLGEIEVKMKFWRGLSGYHSALANKDNNVASVMEVLDCAEDNNDIIDTDGAVDYDEDNSSSSSSSDDDNDDSDGLERRKKLFKSNKNEGSDLSSDGKRGVVDSMQEYKNHRKHLHRRNRGLMQWKGPRTVQWMANKVERGGRRVGGLFGHHERDTEIETEV